MTADLARDPLDAAFAFLDDLRAVLDKMRDAPRLSAADLPDIKDALEVAIYDVDTQVHGPCRGDPGPCRGCAVKLGQKGRWTALLHRLGGKAA